MTSSNICAEASAGAMLSDIASAIGVRFMWQISV